MNNNVKLPCGCSGYPRPALEHDRTCEARITFFGGDVKWDTSKLQYRDKNCYQWNDQLSTWKLKFN